MTKFIRPDLRGVAADSSACVRKLTTRDCVSEYDGAEPQSRLAIYDNQRRFLWTGVYIHAGAQGIPVVRSSVPPGEEHLRVEGRQSPQSLGRWHQSVAVFRKFLRKRG